MSTPVSSRIRRARIAEEMTFGADMSGSISTAFSDVTLREGSTITISREVLRPDRVRQRLYDEPLRILGARSAEAQLQTFLAPTGSALDSAATAPSAPPGALGLLLRALLGGWAANKGDTESAASASTASSIEVTTDATRWSPGALVGVRVGGRYEVRRVAAAAGTTITLEDAVSATPDNGAEVLNSHAFYMAQDPARSLQLVVEEEERDNVWWLRGCAGRLSFGMGLRELLQLTAALRAATYAHDDEVSSPIGGSALSAASYSDGEALPALDGEVLLFAGSSPRSPVNAHPFDISLELTWDYQPINSPSGVETIRRWRLVPGDDFPAKLTLTLPSETGLLASGEGTAKTLETWRRDRTEVRAMIQFGSAAGRMVAFSLPTLQVIEVTPQDSGGLHAVRVVLGAREGSGSDDLARSPLVVGLL